MILLLTATDSCSRSLPYHIHLHDDLGQKSFHAPHVIADLGIQNNENGKREDHLCTRLNIQLLSQSTGFGLEKHTKSEDRNGPANASTVCKRSFPVLTKWNFPTTALFIQSSVIWRQAKRGLVITYIINTLLSLFYALHSQSTSCLAGLLSWYDDKYPSGPPFGQVAWLFPACY